MKSATVPMSAFSLALVSAGMLAQPAIADRVDAAFCSALVNAVSDRIRELPAAKIEDGLCEISARLVKAIAARDGATERTCTSALALYMTEFQRRFPQRKASEVSGRCPQSAR